MTFGLLTFNRGFVKLDFSISIVVVFFWDRLEILGRTAEPANSRIVCKGLREVSHGVFNEIWTLFPSISSA